MPRIVFVNGTPATMSTLIPSPKRVFWVISLLQEINAIEAPAMNAKPNDNFFMVYSSSKL